MTSNLKGPLSKQQHTVPNLICAADGKLHLSEAHKAGCPVCNPTKTVPELNAAADALLTSNQQLLPCPFCGAAACCSHGYEPCARHDHYEGDGIECHTPPMCAIYCETALCPASGNTLDMKSDLIAIQENNLWRPAFLKAAEIWNRRALSDDSSAPKRHIRGCDCYACHYVKKHPQVKPHHALCGCFECDPPAVETSPKPIPPRPRFNATAGWLLCGSPVSPEDALNAFVAHADAVHDEIIRFWRDNQRLKIEVHELIGAAAAHSDRAEEHRLDNERLRGDPKERPANPLEGYCPGKRFIRSALFERFLKQGFWHAHHVDLVWRYNGQDVREEADWLKDVWYALKEDSPVETSAPRCPWCGGPHIGTDCKAEKVNAEVRTDVGVSTASPAEEIPLAAQPALKASTDRAAIDASALADAHRMYEAEHGEPFTPNGLANGGNK